MLRKNRNILLKKDDVGMPKGSTRDLPIFGHSYGLPGARDSEGVARCKYYNHNYNVVLEILIIISVYLVTTVWTAHQAQADKKYEKNFKSSNKLSLANKLTTCRAQSAYRKTMNNYLPRLKNTIRDHPVFLPEE